MNRKQIILKLTRLIIFLLLLILLSACQKNNKEMEYFYLNTPFSLANGDMITDESEQLEIKFLNVLNDSRCPENLTCFWEGVAEIKIQLRNENNSTSLNLPIYGYVNKENTERHVTIDTLNFNFTLLQLDPYPVNEQNDNNVDYTAHLIIIEEN